MKVTIELRGGGGKNWRILEKNATTMTQTIENALLLGAQRSALVQSLLDETCDEFDNALSKLAS